MTTISQQNRTNPLGNKVTRMFTIAPVEEETTPVRAGRLVIGVEYRMLDDAVMNASYTPEQMAIINQSRPEKGFDEHGVSLHVMDGDSGDELIRFDCFADDPHYHYLPDKEWQYVVSYDLTAGCDFYDFALDALRYRLPAMLRFVGADELADVAQQTDLAALTDEVDRIARSGLSVGA
jgi:hypothetical protein